MKEEKEENNDRVKMSETSENQSQRIQVSKSPYIKYLFTYI